METASTRTHAPPWAFDWGKVAGALEEERRADLEPLVADVAEARELIRALDARLEAARAARGRPSHVDALETTCEDALEAMRKRPGGPPVVAAVVYLVVLDAWERTGTWSELRAVIRELDAGIDCFVKAESRRERLDPRQAQLLQLLEGLRLRLTRTEPMLAVESALNLSAAGEMAKHAGDVVKSAEAALDWAGQVELPAELDCITEELCRAAKADRLYYECIVSTAEAVQALNGRAVNDGVVDRAIQKLEAAEDGKRLEAAESDAEIAWGPVEKSELRAHRLTLCALRDHAGEPSLHVGKARIVYCYPFGLRFDLDWKMLASKATWRLPLYSGGKTIRVANVRLLPLTDMWRYDEDDERGYRGVELQLDVPHVSSDEEEIEYHVTVRLSVLGNHYLRVERSLEDARLHTVYAALRRGVRESGEESLGCGTSSWERLPELADTAIEGVALRLALLTHAWRRRTPFPAKQTSFHAILSISELNVQFPDGDPLPATAADVSRSDVVGLSLLGQPVRQFATALEEWVRYPVPDVLGENLFTDRGFAGDVAVGTSNTTVFLLTTMPDWLLDEFEEMAAFAASLPPLFEREKLSLAASRKWAHGRVVPELHEALEEGRGVEPSEYEKHTLDVGQQAVRVQASLVRSDDLVRSAVHRSFLDQLLKRSTVPRLEREIMTELDRLSSLYANLAAEAQIISERYERGRRERARTRLEVVLAVLGALALFHVWTYFNDSFHLRGPGSWVEIGLTILIVIGLAVWVYEDLQRHDSRRPRRATGRGPDVAS